MNGRSINSSGWPYAGTRRLRPVTCDRHQDWYADA
jgi:hypothetical protein